MAPRREYLPDGSVRIVFAAPILLHGEAKGSLTLRPPTVDEYLELGDPNYVVYSDEGQVMPHIDRPLLRRWAARLVEGHDLDIVGRQRDLALGLAIEGAVLDFFRNARKRSKAASAP